VSGPPSPAPTPIPVPAALQARYADWDRTLAWQIVDDLCTYRLRPPPGVDRPDRFLKLTVRGVYPSLAQEAARMRWAAQHLPVPTPLEEGSDAGIDWLVTGALGGADATDPSLLADVEGLVVVLAEGLRAFHDAAPVATCPFDFRVDAALEHARGRVDRGIVSGDEHFHAEFSNLTPTEAMRRLERTRPHEEDLVVCHGDYCPPNVLLSGGVVTGYLDLGELGVADRWWDLAVATWAVTWNYGAGHEERFLAAYGVERDAARTEYYRLLYDLAS